MKKIVQTNLKIMFALWGVDLLCSYTIPDLIPILLFVYTLGLPIVLLQITRIISQQQQHFNYLFSLICCLVFQALIAFSPLARIAYAITHHRPLMDNESWIWFWQPLVLSYAIIVVGWLLQVFRYPNREYGSQ